MKNRNLITVALATVIAMSAVAVYAGCFGKTKTCPTASDSCAGTTTTGNSCTYTAPSPTYDVCDTANTAETGVICSTGPGLNSGISTVTYAGTCANGVCNNGVAQGPGSLMTPQPPKVSLPSCGG